MAYDVTRKATVLVGGSTTQTEMWSWNGSAWSKKAPALMPAPRVGASMVYDVLTKKLMLVGGSVIDRTRQGEPAETWAWDGTFWSQQVTPTRPAGRAYAAVTYDATRSQVVLFGGQVDADASQPATLSDTWTYIEQVG